MNDTEPRELKLAELGMMATMSNFEEQLLAMPPERLPDEPYETYKIRRRIANRVKKIRSKTRTGAI